MSILGVDGWCLDADGSPRKILHSILGPPIHGDALQPTLIRTPARSATSVLNNAAVQQQHQQQQQQQQLYTTIQYADVTSPLQSSIPENPRSQDVETSKTDGVYPPPPTDPSLRALERFENMKIKGAWVLRLAHFRALSRKYYETWKRYSSRALWQREHQIQTKKKLKNPAFPDVCPDDSVPSDELRRQLVVARSRAAALKRMCDALEKTVIHATKENEDLQIKVAELSTTGGYRYIPVEQPAALVHVDEIPRPRSRSQRFSMRSDATSPGYTHRHRSRSQRLSHRSSMASSSGMSLDNMSIADSSFVKTQADRMHAYLTSMTVDEPAIESLLLSFTTQSDWHATNREFKKKFFHFKNGNLREALAVELTQRELGRCKEGMKKNGVQFDALTPSSSKVVKSNPPQAAIKVLPERKTSISKTRLKKDSTPKSRKITTIQSPSKDVTVVSPPVTPPRVIETKSVSNYSFPSSNDVPRSMELPASEIEIIEGSQSPGHRPSETESSSVPASISYTDGDGDKISFTVLNGTDLVYSVNNSPRPPTKCVVVSEGEIRLDFPDIGKAVMLPEDHTNKFSILATLLMYAEKCNVGHNILRYYD